MPGEKDLVQLLKTMQPSLNEGEYVFCTVANLADIPTDQIISFFKESEGYTIILTKSLADQCQLDYSFVAAWITLTVHSALDAVGRVIGVTSRGGAACAVAAAPSVAHALERIVGVFEGSMQKQIVLQLANSLQGIIAQDLLPAVDRNRRVLAYELLLANGAVRNLIRENKIAQMYSVIQTSLGAGMQTLDQCLQELIRRNLITPAEARLNAKQGEMFA